MPLPSTVMFKLKFQPSNRFMLGSLVTLDVAHCYLWIFTIYINIKIGKYSC